MMLALLGLRTHRPRAQLRGSRHQDASSRALDMEELRLDPQIRQDHEVRIEKSGSHGALYINLDGC